MSIEEDDFPAAIHQTGEYLAHIHLANSNRIHPDAGHTDFAPIFAALDDIGFDGYLAMECGVRDDARTVLPEMVRNLRALTP